MDDLLDKPLTEIPLRKQKLEPQIFSAVKRDIVLRALQQCDGSPTKAAALLGITRMQVWRYRKNMGLI